MLRASFPNMADYERAEAAPAATGGKDLPIDLTVVVPFLDEELVLPRFCSALEAALDALGRPYEVIFVDDGSTDSGPEWLRDHAAQQWQSARVVSLTRNFGHMSALTAGLDMSVGTWVASLDADLQHPPELIVELLNLAESTGVPVAQAVRRERSADSVGKRLTAKIYYSGMKRFGTVETPANVADFRIIHRRVVDQICALPERARVYRLLLPWLGYRTAYLDYEAAPRAAGRGKYSPTRMMRLALTSLTSFSTAPLRIATGIGTAVGILGLLGALFVMVNWVLGTPLTGWPSLMAAVLIIGGVQLVTVGILGEYTAEILEQVRGRPRYVVDAAEPGDTDSPSARRQAAPTPETDHVSPWDRGPGSQQ